MSSDIHALSGAYAVDALDDAERADFEQHLTACEACRNEVADLRRAAVELAATTEVTAPPSLRASVLAGIAEVRPLPPLEPAETPAAIPSNVRALPVRRAWRSIGLAAAAAAIVAGGTTVAMHPWSQDRTPVYNAASQVIHAHDMQRFSGTVLGGGKVTVYRSAALNRAVIVASGMPPAPDGRVYELWLQNQTGGMRRAGLFDDGSSLTQVLHGDPGASRAVGITIEPAGGSEQPTTKPIAYVPLASA